MEEHACSEPQGTRSRLIRFQQPWQAHAWERNVFERAEGEHPFNRDHSSEDQNYGATLVDELHPR
jgi:hypothetical protein